MQNKNDNKNLSSNTDKEMTLQQQQQLKILEDPKEILPNVSYEFFENNRYKITDFEINKEQYSAICNNGFIKLHSYKCKSYWLCQNENEHTPKDWKFHVSVDHDDIKNAWNLIAKIFLEIKCRSGMKVCYIRENQLLPKGREITIYIFKYDSKAYGDSEIKQLYDFDFCDEHSEDFWIQFFFRIEFCLKSNRIKPNGLAEGDLMLGEYVSLRNEAYVKVKENFMYPPDEFGWNAAGHDLPFDVRKFYKSNVIIKDFKSLLRNQTINKCVFFICFIVLFLSLIKYHLYK